MNNHFSYEPATIAAVGLLIDYRIRFLEELSGVQPAQTTTALRNSLHDYFSKAIADGSYICWMAQKDGIVAGLGGMAIWQKPGNFKTPGGKVGYILNMYTLPAFRKQGICSSLMEKLIESAKAMDVDILELHTTADGEPVYRKYAFNEPKSPVLECLL